ncbi:gamma-glutamyltransferase [Jannaschia sp. LMIT008]|uniref:gamma-glutamyltransferase n=1 Tax=Jannaschia maritima TaxID=3032585 RepID=UPI002810CB19|nr:gamma-glutamyltransferase [Jannaschia sp. LMIT008]
MRAVTTAQPPATDAAAAVLRDGGSAADAAIAAAFVQSVVDPMNAGPGGFGASLVHRAGQGVRAWVFPARRPAADMPAAWATGYRGRSADGLSHVVQGDPNARGPAAIAVPGWLPGLRALHEWGGTMPWGDLIAPAIRSARDGFAISADFARLVASGPYADRMASARAVFGAARAGQVCRNPAYAATLTAIAGGTDPAPPPGASWSAAEVVPAEVVAPATWGDLHATPHPTAGGIVLDALRHGASPDALRRAWAAASREPAAAGTTHISVVDGNCAVALSSSLALPSGDFTGGHFWNGCMSGFDPRPGGSAPGQPRLSALAPVLAVTDGRPTLVAGAQGGAHIPAALVQVLAARRAGQGLAAAIDRPRWGLDGDGVALDPRADADLRAAHPDAAIAAAPRPFGAVHAIDPDGPVADPARGGAVWRG